MQAGSCQTILDKTPLPVAMKLKILKNFQIYKTKQKKIILLLKLDGSISYNSDYCLSQLDTRLKFESSQSISQKNWKEEIARPQKMGPQQIEPQQMEVFTCGQKIDSAI